MGLTCSGLQICFPLSPKHLALFFDTDVYSVGAWNEDIVDVTDVRDVDGFNTLQLGAADTTVYYRSASMQPAIDRLPLNARDDKHGISGARYRAEEGTHNYLIVVSHRTLDVRLRAGVIKVRDEQRIPWAERQQRWRPEAEALAELIRQRRDGGRGRTRKGARREQAASRAPRGSGRFIRVDDD